MTIVCSTGRPRQSDTTLGQNRCGSPPISGWYLHKNFGPKRSENLCRKCSMRTLLSAIIGIPLKLRSKSKYPLLSYSSTSSITCSNWFFLGEVQKYNEVIQYWISGKYSIIHFTFQLLVLLYLYFLLPTTYLVSEVLVPVVFTKVHKF